ncbi:hypothetical protein F3Y22_tig00110418pilonHSYRG00175 [Hibiscus syriacus]|uniref:Uncharacterized protein n=1 Tax=Hibiscus syriacus TaxID=106335 RepID=A0A6A3AMB1_HIBSY|nr:protein NRT1/ PTR FAMILY 5.7-like [Hibiscus syriacus]KAE8705751.1 hypothetical protein F3Y22_tig00110418pilonHSYRG00175 [Hibiscus syriacus]
MLWLSSTPVSLGTSNRTLYIALLLILVGLAGEEASLPSILEKQFEDDEIAVDGRGTEKQKKREHNRIVWGRANLWSYGAAFLAKFTYWMLLPSNLGWEQRVKDSFIAVAVSYVVFICGRCCYELGRPTRLPVAARFKEATRLFKLIPLWLLFIPYTLVEAAGSTVFILQSYRLVNPRISRSLSEEIPPTSLYVLGKFTSFLVSASASFLIDKVWRNENKQHRARYVRMSVGLLIASGSSLSSWLVETRRLKLIGEEEDPMTQIPMTILWLAPQFALLGIANGLIKKGLADFFYDRAPVSMWDLEFLVNSGVMCIGYGLTAVAPFLAGGWIADEINDCRFDKYMRMLTFLNIAVVPVYIFFSLMFDWSIPEKVNWREIEIEMEDVEDVRLQL